MRHPILITRRVFLTLAAFLAIAAPGMAQMTWWELAHPDNPHSMAYDAVISISPLITTTNSQSLPVLVILLEFGDVTHQDVHSSGFISDFVFGDGSGPWSSQEPSMKEIIWNASNGRFMIVPAPETHGTVDDGVVGWMQAQCPPGMSGYFCVGDDEDGDPCDPSSPNPCASDDGICAACDSWDYYRYNDWKKRAEAVRRADAYVDFSGYDSRTVDWDPGADGHVTDNEFAVMVIHAKPNCTDEHGHPDWGGGGACNVGTVRPTDPAPIITDEGVELLIHPGVIPEGGSAQVLAHEFSHQLFGVGDLYNNFGSGNPDIRALDGTFVYPCKIGEDPPQAPCNDECADAICLDDGGLWGGTWVAQGNTEAASGSDETSCAVGDTADVWYTYTPAQSGDVTIKLDGSTYMSLAVFDSCGGSELAGGCVVDIDPELTLHMTGGVTYWIRIAADLGGTSWYSIDIDGGAGICDRVYDSKWLPEQPGPLSIMDAVGSTYMPMLSPWASIHLGFTRPLIVEEDGTYTLYRAETRRSSTLQITQPEALVIYDATRPSPTKEYFILENRAPEPRSAPGTTYDEGLAIWRAYEYPYPGQSSLDARRTIRLLRPKLWSDYSAILWDGADPDYYDLTPSSSPRNTNWVDGTTSYIEILNVSAAGPEMTVDVRLAGVFVDGGHSGTESGTPDEPYDTLSEAVTAVTTSGRRQTIRGAPGTYPENGLVIDTPCTVLPWSEGTLYIGQ